jgi:hypothetical protein
VGYSCVIPFRAGWFTATLFVAPTGIATIFDIVPGFGQTFAPRKWTPTGDARLCGQVLFFDTAHRRNPSLLRSLSSLRASNDGLLAVVLAIGLV